MTRRISLGIVVLLFAACAHQQRYTVLMSGNKAGEQIVTRRGAQTITDFTFNDRGRGPKLHAVARVDERGVPTSIDITGNDYLKSPVEERLTTAGDRVTWKNSAESGEGKPGAYYSAMYGPPEESAMLARALLKAGGKLSLHPGGEATIRKVGEENVRGTHVTAYEIAGLGFQPSEVWLDDDLNLFATVSSWSSTINTFLAITNLFYLQPSTGREIDGHGFEVFHSSPGEQRSLAGKPSTIRANSSN